MHKIPVSLVLSAGRPCKPGASFDVPAGTMVTLPVDSLNVPGVDVPIPTEPTTCKVEPIDDEAEEMKPELSVERPVTPSVEDKVAAPATPSVPEAERA